VGIVSAVKRIWGKAIQTDAKISPSNYGGPLVDVEGRILGILVPLSPAENSEVAGVGWYDSGIGFAIPMPAALESAERLKAGKDLLPGLIGISFKGRNIYDGEPVIDRVRYGSPAAKAGIKPGDVIVEADGQPTPRQAALRQVLGNKFADDLLTLTVRRGAERIRVEVTLVAELLPYESPFLGVLPARAAAAAGGEAPAGVGIRYVYPDSPASQAGLQEGDRITSADGQPVADAAALYDVVSRRRVGDRIPLQYQRDGESRTAEAVLSSIPAVTPPELQRVFIEAPANPPAADGPKLGRYTDRLPGHEQDYWAYVPEGYNAAAAYGLVVFLHPGGDTMEAAMIKEWKSLCDERGLVLAGPKAKQIAGWQPNEADFVVEVLDHFVKTYHIDPERVVVHSHGNAGVMAWHTAFEHRDKVRGAIVSGMPLTRPLPDNEPDLRFQAYLYAGMRDPLARGVQQAAELLRAAKFPVQSTIFPELDASYPPTVVIEEMARWIDALDRI
jgi:serine protease Do